LNSTKKKENVEEKY